MSAPFIRPTIAIANPNSNRPKLSLPSLALQPSPSPSYSEGRPRFTPTPYQPQQEPGSATSAGNSFNQEIRRALGVEDELEESLASGTPKPAAPVSMGDLDEEGWRNAAREGEITELGKLGEGTSGTVTKCALRSSSGVVFALKTVPADPNPEVQRQILREIAFNRSCSSPHIVQYYGAFLADPHSNLSICMEFCEGGSLDAIYKRVKARGGRTGEKVLGKIADGVLNGLGYLHDRRIIHRDIKPSNILLTRTGQVKLCDFGVSGELVNSLAGTFTGTSYYMAPERIQGEPYTVTSDVWSLGLTLMEVAQNRFPFPPEGEPPLMPIELLTYIVSTPSPELQDEPQLGIKWSAAFKHFLNICLTKDRTQRPSPRQMLGHPWVEGMRQKKVDVAKFLQQVWEWEA
ncbi:Protein kinase C signaling pathway involved MAPKK protein [Saitoella coloradoensis]